MSELIDRDEEHLRLLKLSYYVLAGLTAFFALMPTLLFSVIGGILSSGLIPMTESQRAQADPRAFGWIMLTFAAVAFGMGAASAFGTFLVARSLRDRHRRTFCIVVAAFSCLYIPWGTIIGISTIIVLNRPSVRTLFGEKPRAHAPAAAP